MYAIVRTGGKQYKVSEGEIVKVELLRLEEGAKVELETLFCADGEKIVMGEEAKNVKVTATVLGDGKAKKIRIFTYKAKKNVRHRQGHRQPFTSIKIESITL
ncbi:MAG: 50S ribosomal protein L21 [Clostridia bacterium]